MVIFFVTEGLKISFGHPIHLFLFDSEYFCDSVLVICPFKGQPWGSWVIKRRKWNNDNVYTKGIRMD